MSDRELYWCAHCYAPLPPYPSNPEEEECEKCHHAIRCERDYLTLVQWVMAVGRDNDLEHAARADGLIT